MKRVRSLACLPAGRQPAPLFLLACAFSPSSRSSLAHIWRGAQAGKDQRQSVERAQPAIELAAAAAAIAASAFSIPSGRRHRLGRSLQNCGTDKTADC